MLPAACRCQRLLFAVLLWAVPYGALALDLLQSYRLAIQQDAIFQAARAEAAAARESEPQALAQLLPNVSANLTRSKDTTDSTVPGFLGPLQSRDQYISSSSALIVRQPLYRKFNFAQYRQAQSQVRSSDAALEKNLQDLAVRLAAAYLDALMAQDQMALVLAQKEAYAVQVKAAQRAFETGLGTRTDIDDAQARYDLALAQELEAKQNVDYSKRQLAVIVNQPVDRMALLEPARMQLVAPSPADPEDWIRRGEEVNAELRALRANIETAKQELEKARAGHFPTIDLIAQRSRDQSASTATINQLYLTSMVGVQVNVPLFAGGYSISQERQALAAIERQQQLYEARRREIDQQIRKEFQNVAEGVLKVKAQEQAERSAEQAVFSNQKGFQAGTRTMVDILNAQQQRMNARRDLAQQRYSYLMAGFRLQAMVNALDENEIARVNGWLVGAPATAASMK